jgi:hypothetical protein
MWYSTSIRSNFPLPAGNGTVYPGFRSSDSERIEAMRVEDGGVLRREVDKIIIFRITCFSPDLHVFSSFTVASFGLSDPLTLTSSATKTIPAKVQLISV